MRPAMQASHVALPFMEAGFASRLAYAGHTADT